MKKICLLLAAVMLLTVPLSALAEEISTLPAPEFTIVIPGESFDDGFLLEPAPDNDNEENAEEIPEEKDDGDASQDKELVPDDPEDDNSEDTPDHDDTNGEGEEKTPSIDKIVDNYEDYEIEAFSFTPLTHPTIYNVFVDVYSGVAEITVYGDSLEGKTVGLKIVPIGNEDKIVYARQIEIGSYSGCVVTADLNGSESQLFRLTVEGGDLGRYDSIFSCGEADKLTCTRTATGVKVESTADIAATQNVVVKIMDGREEVFVRQIKTDSLGKYSVSALLPDANGDYIVYVTEGLTGRQYAKTVGSQVGTGAVYTTEHTITGSAGKQIEAIIYAKDIRDTSKYTYEIIYDSSALSVKNMDLLGDNIHIISFEKGRIVFTSSDRNLNGKVWSGTINALLFEFLSGSSEAKITLNVYDQ